MFKDMFIGMYEPELKNKCLILPEEWAEIVQDICYVFIYEDDLYIYPKGGEKTIEELRQYEQKSYFSVCPVKDGVIYLTDALFNYASNIKNGALYGMQNYIILIDNTLNQMDEDIFEKLKNEFFDFTS